MVVYQLLDFFVEMFPFMCHELVWFSRYWRCYITRNNNSIEMLQIKVLKRGIRNVYPYYHSYLNYNVSGFYKVLTCPDQRSIELAIFTFQNTPSLLRR